MLVHSGYPELYMPVMETLDSLDFDDSEIAELVKRLDWKLGEEVKATQEETNSDGAKSEKPTEVV